MRQNTEANGQVTPTALTGRLLRSVAKYPLSHNRADQDVCGRSLRQRRMTPVNLIVERLVG